MIRDELMGNEWNLIEAKELCKKKLNEFMVEDENEEKINKLNEKNK